jgi:UDP-N-acetylglucosamine:LPS N-acetylglucosamine transferase
MIAEKNIEKLSDIVFDLLNDSSKLQSMKEALAQAHANNHWEEILKEVLDLAKEGGGKK